MHYNIEFDHLSVGWLPFVGQKLEIEGVHHSYLLRLRLIGNCWLELEEVHHGT